ncbi:cytokine receptor family member B16 [Tachysurus fulvidraco]|uniref:cytokine receptor family member B16 n=1 Tax=Tachysurus fulvidraco TaxID=1234273 RepID=UPI000F4D8B94|nr:cytokine receptor family member B16 [Tachysurus fulvidraco]
MLQMRSLIETVTSAFLIATLSHAALLPASLNVSIQSENMRHILKWSPLKESCFSLNYTVRYQGEFEYMQNGRWQDEPSCANIVQTECDLTVALSSDSDYNISVLAWCDDSTLWTQLPESFNRRDTVLLAPQMDVNTKDDLIEVYFGERQNHININLKIWKEGDEENASVTEITGNRFHHHVGQGGAGTYCLRAEAVLDLSNKRSSTERCVRVNEPEPSLLIPLTAGIAVTLSLMLALILGLITPRCSLWIRKSVYKKEAMPKALLDWSKSTPILLNKALHESTHTVFLLDPSQEPERTSETNDDV